MGKRCKQGNSGGSGPRGQATSEAKAKRYLCQEDLVGEFPGCFARDGWTILYCHDKTETSLLDISAALVEPAAVRQALQSYDPDINPVYCPIIEPSEDKDLYEKPGFKRGLSPIVRVRYFFDSHPEYLELAEDFRLHYNLYEKPRSSDMARRDLFEIDRAGKGTLVARITRTCVGVRSPYLDKFLQSTGLCLALHIRSLRFSDLTLDAVAREHRSRVKDDRTTYWRLHVEKHWQDEKFKSASEFCGKKMLCPSGMRKTERPRPKIDWPRVKPRGVTDITLSNRTLERLHTQFPVGTHTGWQPVFLDKFNNQCGIILTSVLVKPSESRKILEDGKVWSSFVASLRGNIDLAKTRAGEDEDGLHKVCGEVFPFVMSRRYARDTLDHNEVIEEFRLFHNLAWDPRRQTLHTFDKSGTPVDVVRFDNTSVEIRRKHLCEFLGVADYHLIVFLRSARPTREADDLMLNTKEIVGDPGVYDKRVRLKVCEDKGNQFTLIEQKAVVYPPSADKHAASQTEQREIPFILGLDKFGRQVEGTSLHWVTEDNPYVTIYFRGAVLDKYYRNRKNYRVRWAYINCQRRWSLDILNFGNYVGVSHTCLRRLPIEEQHHWRSYNVSLSDASKLGELRASSPIDRFLDRYNLLNDAWFRAYQWPLFKEPAEKDRYILERLAMPIKMEGDFDDRVLDLTKILVEKLNLGGRTSRVKRMNRGKKRKKSDVRSDPKRERQMKDYKGSSGFSPLGREICLLLSRVRVFLGGPERRGVRKNWETRVRIFLESCGHEDPEWVAKFIGLLWRLRSAGSAHTKNPKYESTLREMELDLQKDPQEVFNDLAEDAIGVLSSLEDLLPARKSYTSA